jgi:hypothetical protein
LFHLLCAAKSSGSFSPHNKFFNRANGHHLLAAILELVFLELQLQWTPELLFFE